MNQKLLLSAMLREVNIRLESAIGVAILRKHERTMPQDCLIHDYAVVTHGLRNDRQ
jgi:hypothetical protein